MHDLRGLIREVLAEELARLSPGGAAAAAARPQPTVEVVRIRTNADLAAFVERLLTAAQDGRLRAEVAAGRRVFRLADAPGAGAGAGAPPAPPAHAHRPLAPPPGAAAPARFERGLVSERDIAALPAGARSVVLGRQARLTPLARDELRRRGIAIERTGR